MNQPSSAPPANLNGEMRSRVQQLRLDQQLGMAKSGGGGLGGAAVWLPWGLCLLLGLAWAGVALRTYRNAPESEIVFDTVGPGESAVRSAPAVNTNKPGSASTTPTAPEGSVVLEVKGYIISAIQVNISPIDVSGRLMELYFKEGQFVKAGEPLAKIDATTYQYALDEAKMNVVAAKERQNAAKQRLAELDPASVRPIEREQIEAQIGEAKAVFNRALDERKRIEALRASVSPRDVDIAVNDAISAEFRLKKLELDLKLLLMGPRPERLAAAKAELLTADAELKTAEARLANAQWRVDNCLVRAPFDGTITQKGSEIGSLVNPAAFGNISAFICGMADLSDLEVELDVPEKDIPKLTVGQPCRIRPDAYPNRIYGGKLDRIMPIAVRASSIVKVRVKIDIPKDEPQGAYLKLETGAVVSFLSGGTATDTAAK